MRSIIVGVVTWLAGNLLPADWIKQKVTDIITRVLTRLFDLADRLAAATSVTDVDDKAVLALRSYLMAEGVIAHFVDVVYSLIFSQPPPAPVDPLNPPTPVDPPQPRSPGILRRIGNLLRKAW